MKTSLADRPFAELLEHVADRTPAPGGGSSSAWACALAASLVEMAAAFARPPARRRPRAHVGASGPRARARGRGPGGLRRRARGDAAAQGGSGAGRPRGVRPLFRRRRPARDGPGGDGRGRPGRRARGRRQPAPGGDAVAGALLAEAAARAAVSLVELNLADAPGDSRLAEASELAKSAASARPERSAKDEPGGGWPDHGSLMTRRVAGRSVVPQGARAAFGDALPTPRSARFRCQDGDKLGRSSSFAA
jgi:hypothetical protein